MRKYFHVLALSVLAIQLLGATSRTFNGTSDSINAGTATPIDNVFSNGGTAAVWIFGNNLGENGTGRIIAKTSDTLGTSGWHLAAEDADNARSYAFARGFSVSRGKWTTNADTYISNRWNFITITYNDGFILNDPVIYINGAAATVTEKVTPLGDPQDDNAQSLIIGNRSSATEDRTWNGSIAYVQLFNVALTANEILELYYTPFSVTRGLVYFAPLWENATALDYSGNNAAGTISTPTANQSSGPPIIAPRRFK